MLILQSFSLYLALKMALKLRQPVHTLQAENWKSIFLGTLTSQNNTIKAQTLEFLCKGVWPEATYSHQVSAICKEIPSEYFI